MSTVSMALRRWIRPLLTVLIVGLFIGYGLRHGAEIVAIAESFRKGIWYWVLAGLGLQVIHYVSHSFNLKYTMRAMGIERSLARCISLQLGGLAVNVVAPSMNAAGIVLIVDEARRAGKDSARAFIAAMLAIIIDSLTFLLTCLLVVVLLINQAQTSGFVLPGMMLIFALVTALIIGLTVFWKKPDLAEQFFRRFGRHGKNLASRWRTLVAQPISTGWVVKAFWAEIPGHCANILSLAMAMAAFGVSPLSIFPLVYYVVSVLSVIFSPTPMGIGITEGAMILAMTAQGISIADATAITLVFRGLNFWLPAIIGFVLLHTTISFHRHSPSDLQEIEDDLAAQEALKSTKKSDA
jgi:phosphatidylglycerol lysyltransferase